MLAHLARLRQCGNGRFLQQLRATVFTNCGNSPPTKSCLRNGACAYRGLVNGYEHNSRNILKAWNCDSVRFCSKGPAKGNRPVGYWLLTCGGMVFVAVVLGTGVVYYFTLATIYEVLDEILKKTVR